MSPTIREENTLLISKYNLNEELNIGDIIVFRDSDNDLIAHRVVGFDNEFVITKGDNNIATDEKITRDNIRNIVECVCYT